MLHALSIYLSWFVHPLSGKGYQYQSGIGSTYTPKDIVYMGAILKVAHHRNCHHKGCWSIHTHNHPDHGWPSCKRHWNETPEHLT